MSDVIVEMKLSPAKAGALYMKSLRLEDEIEELKQKADEAAELLSDIYNSGAHIDEDHILRIKNLWINHANSQDQTKRD